MKTRASNQEVSKLRSSNRYSSSKPATIVFILVWYLLIPQSSFADERNLDTTLTKAEIEQLINAPESDRRQAAPESILDAIDLDTTWAFETMIKGIEIEQDYLERSNEINQTYVWISWRNIQKYIRDLAFVGSCSPASLRDFGENLPPSQKTWVLIAEGYQKNEMLHDKLREIFREKGNPLQKAMAVEAISQYKDTLDIPILFDAAMDNENSIDWAGDTDLPGFNPVAEAGNIALWKMGYILEWDAQEFIVKLKKREEVDNK